MKIKNPGQKIAIIGAGPAGILAGVELQKAGYKDITIYGKFEEAQCRTKQIDGVVADVGTCYVHAGYYNTIKKLVGDYDIHIKYLGEAPKSVNSTDIHTAVQPSTREKIMTYLGLAYFLLHGLLWKLLRYTYLGRYIYGVSFERYLQQVGLGKLAHGFVFGPGGVAQGYGFLKDVNAYRLFRWFRPSIFLTPILNKKRRGTGIIAEGYGTLFKRIYDTLPKHHAVRVQSVVPTNKEEVQVSLENGEVMTYDMVIVACPLSAVKTPVSKMIQPESLQSTPLFSYLWTSEKAPHFEDRMYLLDYIKEDKTDVISTFRKWGKTNAGLHVYWGVGYASADISREALQVKLQQQVSDEFLLPQKQLEFFNIFDYNPRFSVAAIREGLHLDIRKAQGENNIWYTGGMLSHWDVDSIYEFDINLVHQLVYKNNPSLGNGIKFIFRRISRFFSEF